MRLNRRLIAAGIAIGLCTTAQAFEFTNVYILGDSLSDAGQYGARFIVVYNLRDMGRTPAGTASGAAAVAALSGLSVSVFNSALNNGLNTIGFDVIPVNIQALFGEVLANPSLYGFTNTTTPACTS